MNEFWPTSIFIEGKSWHDKTGGNSYFSTNVYVNGELLLVLPFQYGYDSQYIYESLRELARQGIIPDENSRYGFGIHALKALGVAAYYSITPSKKAELAKHFRAYPLPANTQLADITKGAN